MHAVWALCGHYVLSGMWTSKDMCYGEMNYLLKKVDTMLDSIGNMIGRA